MNPFMAMYRPHDEQAMAKAARPVIVVGLLPGDPETDPQAVFVDLQRGNRLHAVPVGYIEDCNLAHLVGLDRPPVYLGGTE